MQPLLFLDVDGVLNPLGRRDPGTFGDFELHELMGFLVRLSPTMGERLAALDVKIHWLTTWEHRADELVASRVGLPDGLPVCELDGRPGQKERALLRVVSDDPRPFVWIDDEAIPAGGVAWADEHDVDHLLVRTDPRVGLTPDQLDEVATFAGEVSGGHAPSSSPSR